MKANLGATFDAEPRLLIDQKGKCVELDVSKQIGRPQDNSHVPSQVVLAETHHRSVANSFVGGARFVV